MRVMTSLRSSLLFEYVISYEKGERMMDDYAINKSMIVYLSPAKPALELSLR